MGMLSKVLAAACVALVLVVIWQRGTVAKAERNADRAETAAATASAERDNLKNTVAVERARADGAAQIAADLEKEKDDAQARTDALSADLAAGRIRVRRELAAGYTAQLSTAASCGAVDPAAAERGNRIAAAAVGVGARADAQLRACQRQLAEDRAEPALTP